MAEQRMSVTWCKLTVVVLVVVIVVLVGVILFLLDRLSGSSGVLMIPPAQQVCPPAPMTAPTS